MLCYKFLTILIHFLDPGLASVANAPYSDKFEYVDEYPIYKKCGAHVGSPPVFEGVRIQLRIFMEHADKEAESA